MIFQEEIKKHPDLDEHKVWHALKSGSEAALVSIYKKYIHALYNYGARLTSDKAILEDSIQDLFYKLWKQRASLSDVSQVKFYLYKGLKTNILDNINRKNKQEANNERLRDFFFEVALSHENTLIDQENEDRKKRDVQQVISTHLTSRQKEAIILRFYDNLPYEEIAELLSMSTKSTYNLIYRALDTIKSHLDIIPVLLISLLRHLFSQ